MTVDALAASTHSSVPRAVHEVRGAFRKIRLAAKIDIKGGHVIKGVHMEGLRVVGSPAVLCRQYSREGIDEIILIDTVASLYGRNHLAELISEVAREIFIPLVVGGGVRTLEDCRRLFRAGADKIAINTHALARPQLLGEAAAIFGSQSVVLSVHAKRREGWWEAYCENARQPTGRNVLEWIKDAVRAGAGEVLLSSIDQDGTMQGMDVELCRTASAAVSVPVIASGGVGTAAHAAACAADTRVSAVAVGAAFHFGRETVGTLKRGLLERGIGVRRDGSTA